MEKFKIKLYKKSDDILIKKIAQRAHSEVPGSNYLEVFLKVKGTHLYAQKLDLKKLLEFDESNYIHDIYGICDHLNMKTLELDSCFQPRCAKRNINQLKNENNES